MNTPAIQHVNASPMDSRREAVRTILQDAELRTLIAAVARKKKKPEAAVRKKAKRMLRELATDYTPAYVSIFFYHTVRWLRNRLFSKSHVDIAGLERIKKIIGRHPVILLPCHKSHIDYLLLSLILYENGLPLPHIAAGINLSFFPAGHFFRKGGAYFIRRKITGDPVYARILSLYIRRLIETGSLQEFFLEGGRSRSGKLLPPKLGLLSIQVDAFLEGASDDLYAVPVSVVYDRVPEEASYVTELSGREKKPENFLSVIKAGKLLLRSYGAAHVRFSEPISLKTFFPPEAGTTLKVRKAKTRELADETMRSIAAETTVTATALMACALLAQNEPAVTENELKKRLKALLSYLSQTTAHVAPEAEEMEKYFSGTLRFFAKNGWLRPDHRAAVDYYKNGSLHHFLPAAVAASAGDNTDKENFLNDLFAHEFTLPAATAVSVAIAPEYQPLFTGLIRNYLESYDLAARLAAEEHFTAPLSKEKLKAALDFGNRLLAAGEITRPEAVSAASLQSAFAYFHIRGLLKNPDALRAWHRRLKEFLN